MSEATKKYLTEEYVPLLLKNRSILEPSDKRQYQIESIKVLPVATDGTFMLSLCNRVKVDLKDVASNDNFLHLDLVVKLSPTDLPPELFEIIAKKLFANEILVYTKVLPLLTGDDDVGYYPRYYYGAVGDEACSLVLGDFGVDGWRMAPTLVNLSLEHILLAVKYLGKFHGNCYAMKEVNNDEFQDIVRQLGKTRFEQLTTGQPEYDKYMQLAPQRGIRAVRASSEFAVAEEYLNAIEEQLQLPSALCRDLVQPVEPLAVICHGDYLRNNIAFRYDPSGRPIGVTMFDFQTMCYSSPMMDLCTFMANSTGADVRGPHFEEIFRAYHTELIKVLYENGNMAGTPDDPPEKYSHESFLREYLRLLPFGYSVASTFISLLHVPLDGSFTPEIIEGDEAFAEMLRRGGEPVDRELAALIHDMYQLKKGFEC